MNSTVAGHREANLPVQLSPRWRRPVPEQAPPEPDHCHRHRGGKAALLLRAEVQPRGGRGAPRRRCGGRSGKRRGERQRCRQGFGVGLEGGGGGGGRGQCCRERFFFSDHDAILRVHGARSRFGRGRRRGSAPRPGPGWGPGAGGSGCGWGGRSRAPEEVLEGFRRWRHRGGAAEGVGCGRGGDGGWARGPGCGLLRLHVRTFVF